MKLIFKKHINIKKPSILKSYHLLTLFLWFMEQTEEKYWKDDSFTAFENNLKEMLLYVADKIAAKNVPHYFIRKLNLVNLPGLKTLIENGTKFVSLKGVAGHIKGFTKKDGFSK